MSISHFFVIRHQFLLFTNRLCSSSSSDLHDGSRARLDDPHLLVLAAGGQQAAVGVEGHAEDDVGVAVDHLHRLPDLQVPDEDLSQLEKQQAGNCGARID